MPDRRRTGRICPGAVCRPRAEPDSGQCDGRTGTLCRGYSGYRLLGCPHLRDPAGGYRSDHRRGAYRELCAMLQNPKAIIVCEKEEERRLFLRKHYPKVLACTPEECEAYVLAHSEHGGADVVIEAAGTKDTFELAWKCARPNAIVTVVALYEEAQILPLPQMYGKNLTFKTGGVDGCDCGEILSLIEQGKIDTTPLITHRFPLSEINEAYRIFENRLDGVIKIAVTAE